MVKLLLGKLLILLLEFVYYMVGYLEKEKCFFLVNFGYWVFGICVIEVNLFTMRRVRPSGFPNG